MAFSLLEHVQHNKKIQLNLILADLNAEQQQELLAFVLGRLVKLDQQLPEETYQAIHTLNPSFFWQDIDQQLTLSALSQHTSLAEHSIQTMLEKLFVLIVSEIKQLDEAANLEQTGVSELLQGQTEYLHGKADDWLWDLIQLNEVKGQPTHTLEPVDLSKSIADLSSMIHEANKSANASSLQNLNQPKPNKLGVIFIIIIVIILAVLGIFLL